MKIKHLINIAAILSITFSVGLAGELSPDGAAQSIETKLEKDGYSCSVYVLRSKGNRHAWHFAITLHNSRTTDVKAFLTATALQIAQATRKTSWTSDSVFVKTGSGSDPEIMAASTADCRKCFTDYVSAEGRALCISGIWSQLESSRFPPDVYGYGNQGGETSYGEDVKFWPGMRSSHPVPVQWEKLAPGFERTVLKFKGQTWTPEPDRQLVPRRIEMVVFRVDTKRYPLRVITAPGLYGMKKARLVNVHNRMKAVLTINGGYFNHDGYAVGMAISDGRVRAKYNKEGGSGALAAFGDTLRIGWSESIARSDPPPEQALQNGPLLIEPGRQFGIMNVRNKYFSRTVVALDKDGKLIIAITRKLYGEQDSRGGLNLFEAAVVLYNPVEIGGLETNVALNLDGGTSTGMQLSLGEHQDSIKVGIGLPNFVCLMPAKR